MIEPYTVVGPIPTFWGARLRADISKNLEHIGQLAKAAVMAVRKAGPCRQETGRVGQRNASKREPYPVSSAYRLNG
jgi:hypothetical protein